MQNLSQYRQRYVDASACKKKRTWDGQPLPTSVVFNSGSHPSTTFRGIPPATFIVPAVLDAIYGSKYAATCVIVPGEAEVYCAAAARESGAIILSNDSDLFVHDLGSNGAFVYLSSVDLRANDNNDKNLPENLCRTIKLSVFRPREISGRLGLDNLQWLAFEIHERPSQTLPEALKAAKTHDGREHKGFLTFLEQYNEEPSVSESQQFSRESLARISSRGKFLDPRISEIICQLELKEQQTGHAYLLCLIEDPVRSSAWLVSSSHRYFAYSIFQIFYNDQIEDSNTFILEHGRRGQTVAAQETPLLSLSEVLAFAFHLHRQLEKYHTHFSGIFRPLVWRLYAMSQVYHWHLDSRRIPPSREALLRLVTGEYKPRPTWDDIHLSAQIQAVLYSLRVIKQILAYTAPAADIFPNPILRDIADILEGLPKMALLIPTSFELATQMSNFDVNDVLDKLAAILTEEAGSDGQDSNHGIEDDGDKDDDLPEVTDASVKKKRKKSKRKKVETLRLSKS